MKVVISNSSGIPIYEQIKEQIKTAILSGDVSEGEILPSIRQMAKDLKISVITTTRAYTDLEQEGFVANVQGKGCYVLSINSNIVREQLLREVESGISTAVNAAKTAKLSRQEFEEILNSICKEEKYE